MNILAELKQRLAPALAGLGVDPAPYLEMIRVAQDPKFGDYQANFAMPLKGVLNRPPREIAEEVVKQANLADLCEPPEIAGPGFINLRLRDDWLVWQLTAAAADDRLGVAPASQPKTYVIDYSSPNVAKPMHVGHIRSTVIGDSLDRLLRFLGHKVISDNHVGDWGTQFGMILYGYKHFVDAPAFAQAPVAELSRLYKLVAQLVTYRESLAARPALEARLAAKQSEVAQLRAAPPSKDKGEAKKAAQHLTRAENQAQEMAEEIAGLDKKIAAVESSPALAKLAAEHPQIDEAVLAETAKLHAGDAENLRLWREFLPNCRDEIQRVYRRLGVRFDHEHGESFYHDRLAGVVGDFRRRGLAKESQGAWCVFLDGFDAPMLIQKKDGAFLYSTTDLATIAYRVETWNPDAVLYVVDHRQSDHFEKLFAAARLWGHTRLELTHVKFGTVMGADGKPFKTREGVAAGLESLLDEAVARAAVVVAENDKDHALSPERRQEVAETVGIGALKYADLSQNRATDYIFSYDKMLAMHGNTATYMQYSYARVQSIFRKAETTAAAVRTSPAPLALGHAAERALALLILRLSEALAAAAATYEPHHLTSYLFDLAKAYSTFFEQCSVLRAESPELKASRLRLCELTARTLRLGLSLLGIGVAEQM